MFNLSVPTFGGKQFWTDQFIFREWRIQKNVWTGHCRLLDERNIRRAWGTLDACKAEFDSIRNKTQMGHLPQKLVILAHGLGRTRRSMKKLAERFSQSGFCPISFEYASMRDSIENHAAALHTVIESLEQVADIFFVGHSMGNIVFRRYLADYGTPTAEKKQSVTAGRSKASDGSIEGESVPTSKADLIRASVMIGPPNQGAYLARLLKPTGIFGLITGKSGKTLGSDWDDVSENLATPSHPFAIIAGKYNVNPLFRVDNDGIVGVDETKLAGAADFKVLPVMHTTMMANKTVVAMADRFLNEGCLVSRESITPIPAEATVTDCDPAENGNQRGLG